MTMIAPPIRIQAGQYPQCLAVLQNHAALMARVRHACHESHDKVRQSRGCAMVGSWLPYERSNNIDIQRLLIYHLSNSSLYTGRRRAIGGYEDLHDLVTPPSFCPGRSRGRARPPWRSGLLRLQIKT